MKRYPIAAKIAGSIEILRVTAPILKPTFDQTFLSALK